MDEKLKILKILANIGDSKWQIGKTDSFISAVNTCASSLPSSVFEKFKLNADPSKKISVVDFVLLTYNMRKEDKENLMEVYGIDHKTIVSILKAASNIAQDTSLER